MPRQAKQFRMSGGVNEEDPQFILPQGTLAFGRNYEVLRGGGYRRIAGYERYDSKASPSDATYKWFSFTGGVVAPTDQLKVKGGTSAAVGFVCGVTPLGGTASWSSGAAAGQVALVVTSGTFQAGEQLQKFSDSSLLCVLSTTSTNGASTDEFYKPWIEGARNYYRNLITTVGDSAGFGSVLGTFMLGGYLYAWRALASDHTKQGLWKATGGAWSAVTLTGYIRYASGNAEVAEGATITGASSGATAVVRRVNIAAGNFAGPTYTSGRFAITNITGTFTNGENLQVSAVTVAVAVGSQVTASTMTATAARHDIVVTNFYGASNLTRAYGVDKVNRGYEFDGTYFINVETGMTTDTPMYVAEHRNHLFYAFPGGSLQNAGTGQPLTWSPRVGAGEIGLGDDPTGLKSNGNNTLAATCARSVQVLTGTSNLDWNLRRIADDLGTVAYSIAEAGGQTVFLDRAGVNILLPAPTPDLNYTTQSISRNIRKTIEASATLAVDSLHARKKSQYRLFFSDKTAIWATFDGGKLMGWAFIKYTHQVTCSTAGPDTSGAERMFAGTSDGYVVELDKGSSFDGDDIESIGQLPFSYYGIPNRNKRFHMLTLEVETPAPVDLYYGIDFDYGASQQPGRVLFEAGTTAALSSFQLFGTLFWSSNVLSAPSVNIMGVGKSMGLAIYHIDAVDEPFTISAATVEYTPFGLKIGGSAN